VLRATRMAARLGLRLTDDPTDATYMLMNVEHVIDTVSGWVTLVDSRPTPEPAAPAGGLSMLPGVVQDVDDPDRAGRVRVRFEVLGTPSPTGCPCSSRRVARQGSPASRTWGDTVAVLQPADAPGHGIVLGGIHTDAADDAAGVRHGAVRGVGLATPDGQRLASTATRTARRSATAPAAGSRSPSPVSSCTRRPTSPSTHADSAC